MHRMGKSHTSRPRRSVRLSRPQLFAPVYDEVVQRYVAQVDEQQAQLERLRELLVSTAWERRPSQEPDGFSSYGPEEETPHGEMVMRTRV